MNVFRWSNWFALTALLAFGSLAWSQQITQQPPAASRNGPEVLTRGPLHEAFAETIAFDPEPGVVIPQSPPDSINELAPDQRPEGPNVTWIPGYWSWDDERSDFLWVSGIWRALPPGRQWIPGYWGQTQQGSQWTSGYWADAAAKEVDYLPEPPASVETGPNVAAPSADATWLPGCWIWQQNRYAWRPGNWVTGNQDWDWVPDHYVWTPSGYVFVDGYYDYSVPRRGVVFAPVYFNQGLRTQANYSYAPTTVLNPAVFARHLFLRSGYGHYYFGDYYGSNYADAGYSPGFSYQSSRRGYDPIYAHQRWQHRHERDWERRVESNFRNFRDNEDARPPRNWAAQRELARRDASRNRDDFAVALPFDELSRRNSGQPRFQPVDPAERQQFGQRGQQYRQYLRQRQQLEANAARSPNAVSTNATRPSRRTFAQSPYAAPPVDQLGKPYAPPQRHQVMKPDLQVQPQPRMRGPGQSQRQGVNQGNRQAAPAGQFQGPANDRGNNRRGAQRQAAPNGQQQGAAPGQRPRGAGGQNPRSNANQSANESQEKQ